MKRSLAEFPKPVLDTELPIFARQQEIQDAITHHQVVVISGATGSGKSTQLPLIALQAGIGQSGLIGHTQPRRIAARSVANRIAEQLGTPLGSTVGFKIRFSDQTNDQTFIKVMTDGILLAETQSDPLLKQYELIIIDEAHERSLNIDFLLGYVKRILAKRSDLRLIITSATIDTERFVEHFSTANSRVPTIDVQGRTYPVEIQYRPCEMDSNSESPIEFEDHLISTIGELAAKESGDILVFLPTENDIRSAHKKLRSIPWQRVETEILPLYARLTNAQQNEIFVPGKRRRIVLATNVAESSITVPRIRFVVDSGTARISHYSPRSKVQRLPIQPISQASADQRAGRCGRIGPGICVRLYSREDYESRPQFTVPEIRRTNLASVILQTLSLKLGKIEEFPFLDPPRPDSIRDGYKTLFELGAVDPHRRLTPLGKKLSRLPVDPRIGRMLFEADHENCLAEILIIASGLEVQDPRMRPAERKGAADEAHRKFANKKSDFLSLLNVWDFFHQQKADLSKSKLKRACEQNFLSYALMIQWQDIHRQLSQMITELGLRPRKRNDDFGAIHRSLLSGLLSGVALSTDKHEYTGAGGVKFNLWPGSSLFRTHPQWIVAAEIVETSKRYGRTLAQISPDWIEPLAKHLVKARYGDPHWSKKRQSVQASEHVSLWGLPIVNGRPVNFGPLDPKVSREIFIEEALTNEGLEGNFSFLKQNRQLIESINDEMAKTRRRDLIIDSYKIASFYEQHLPESIYDKVSLSQSLKQSPTLTSTLMMGRADLLSEPADEMAARQFPDRANLGSMQIPIEYRFSPGDADDGATIRLPLEGVGQLDEVQTAWLVPGLIEPRITTLIRSLPKSLRRNLVPAPETAATISQEIEFGKGDFYEAVARHLTRIGGEPIRVEHFDLSKMDAHLKVNLQVVGEDGTVVAQGRSIAEVRNHLGVEHLATSSFVEVQDQAWVQDGLTDWTWGDLPKEVSIRKGGTELAAFPAIVDQGESVGLRLVDSPARAEQMTRLGLTRLFQIANRKSLKSQLQWLPNLDRHLLTISRWVPAAEAKVHLNDLIARIAFVEREKIPRSAEAFAALESNAVERISMAAQQIARWLPMLTDHLHQVQLAIENRKTVASSVMEDVSRQLERLVHREFLLQTPWNWLSQFPRFLEAIKYRLDKSSSSNVQKDRELARAVAKYWAQYEQAYEHHQKQGIIDPELELFRWMIEEYRVSLFAQHLGTSVKVSDVRLEKQWKLVRTHP